MRRIWRGVVLVAVTGVAVVLLGTILRQLDPGSVARALAQARWGWVALLFAAFVVNHALRAVRWHLILASGTPFRRTAVICLVAFLGITTLPLRLGEVLRPVLHARDGVPMGRLVAALLAERILDLVALLGLLAWAAAVPEVPALRVEGVDATQLARQAALVGIGVLVAALGTGGLFGERLAGWPVVGSTAVSMARAARELAADPARAATAVGLTAATWASTFLYTGCGLRVFPELPGTVGAAAFTWAGIMAAITALPTPGFFGSYEAGAVAALSLYGADRDLAVVFALGMHVAYVGFAALVGLPFVLAEAETVVAAVRPGRI